MLVFSFTFTNLTVAASEKKSVERIINAYQTNDFKQIYDNSFAKLVYKEAVINKLPKFEQEARNKIFMDDDIHDYKEQARFFPKTAKWQIIEEKKSTTRFDKRGINSGQFKSIQVYVGIEYSDKNSAPDFKLEYNSVTNPNSDKTAKIKKSIYVFEFDAKNKLLVRDYAYKELEFF